MKLYLVVVEDRHTDVEIQVYSTLEKALENAKQAVTDNARTDFRAYTDNWEWCCCYSSEGDHVHVETTELDNPV